MSCLPISSNHTHGTGGQTDGRTSATLNAAYREGPIITRKAVVNATYRRWRSGVGYSKWIAQGCAGLESIEYTSSIQRYWRHSTITHENRVDLTEIPRWLCIYCLALITISIGARPGGRCNDSSSSSSNSNSHLYSISLFTDRCGLPG